jgi:adenylosuccinate lyase
VKRELPFMMTENLMMEGVRRGGDRQLLHERVRIHSLAAAATHDLLERIANDPLFGIDRQSIQNLARPENYTGLARQQTERFLIEEIDPILAEHGEEIHAGAGEVRV